MECRAWTGLHVIADAEALPLRAAAEIAAAALAGGASIIQVRIKGGSTRALYDAASNVARVVRGHPAARLVVNDRMDVAIAVGAKAVHLGQDDLSPDDAGRVIALSDCRLAWGLSTHGLAEARRAEEKGAVYIGFGPVFSTGSKADALSPRGLDRLAEVCRAVNIPVIAIGGIDLAGAKNAVAAGAAGVAVISAIAEASDMTGATRSLAALFGANR